MPVWTSLLDPSTRLQSIPACRCEPVCRIHQPVYSLSQHASVNQSAGSINQSTVYSSMPVWTSLLDPSTSLQSIPAWLCEPVCWIHQPVYSLFQKAVNRLQGVFSGTSPMSSARCLELAVTHDHFMLTPELMFPWHLTLRRGVTTECRQVWATQGFCRYSTCNLTWLNTV